MTAGKWSTPDLASPDWLRNHVNAISATLVAIPATILLYYASELDFAAIARHVALQLTNFSSYVITVFYSLAFALFAAVVLTLERLRPADPSQPVISRGLLYDTTIGAVALAFDFVLISVCVRVFIGFFAQFISPVVPIMSQLANWQRFFIVFILLDLANWLSHLIRHKVPIFWQFHALHHSQREMNMMTEFRIHPGDMLIGTLLKSAMFAFLLIPVETAIWLAIFQKYYLMFIHANVDVSYGPLDRIFVSPRVHRQHHAADPARHDTNFGTYLSIWDWLFGTFYSDRDSAPKTGVLDFPDEHDAPARQALAVYCRQVIAPLKTTYRLLFGPKTENAGNPLNDNNSA